jgi:hypothetical protein
MTMMRTFGPMPERTCAYRVRMKAKPADDGVRGRRPDFLIIGAARAATTSMSVWLSLHPEVFIPPAKELFFFDREERWSRGMAWYEEQFAPGRGHRAVGESSTSYMVYEHAVRRIADELPGVRLIAQLRNPVDRAYSHYCYAQAWGVETRTFEEAVADELDGRIEVPGGEYLGRGRYLALLQMVCSSVPRSSLLVLLFDDVKERPDEAFREVCGFIGVDDSLEVEEVGSQLNPSRRAVSSRLWRATRRFRSPLRSAQGRSARIDRLNSRSYEPIDPATRRRLVDHFEAENGALGEWLGRDLSAWQT